MLEQGRLWMPTILQIAAFFFAVFIAIWQQRRIDNRVLEDLGRKHLAARTVLPIALARLSAYISNSLVFFKENYPPQLDSVFLLKERPKFPELPTETITAFKECIVSGELATVRALAEIVKFIQIQNSRMTGISDLRQKEIFLSSHAFDSQIFDLLYLYEMGSACFKYGRLEADFIDLSINKRNIYSASRILGTDDTRYVGLAAYIEGRVKAGELGI